MAFHSRTWEWYKSLEELHSDIYMTVILISFLNSLHKSKVANYQKLFFKTSTGMNLKGQGLNQQNVIVT